MQRTNFMPACTPSTSGLTAWPTILVDLLYLFDRLVKHAACRTSEYGRFKFWHSWNFTVPSISFSWKLSNAISRRMANWFGYILRRKFLLNRIIEGKIEGKRRWGRRRNQLLDGFKAAFLKLFSSRDHFHLSECSTDHPTLGIIKLIRPALNSVRNMFLQQKIPLLLLRVE